METKDKELFEKHKRMYYSQWDAPFTKEYMREVWRKEFEKLYGTDDVQKLFGDYFTCSCNLKNLCSEIQ